VTQSGLSQRWRAWAGSPTRLHGVALGSLIANVTIVITGGAVRLTGSGLGCPTWPRCTDESYTPTPAMGVNGIIEYANRTLTGVLAIIAVLGVLVALAQRPRRRRVVRLSALVLAGIPAQALLGGVTVLTHLNPWVVGCHFLLSMGIIAAAYAFWRSTQEGDGPVEPVIPRPLRHLTGVLIGVAAAVLAVGTVVTGSGPHAGDENAKRNGLDPAAVAQLHADLVFLLIGLSVALWFALRAVDAPPAASRAVTVLIGIELAQGVVGFVQYATHLPELVVGVHMAGACAVWLATLAVWFASRTRAATGQSENGRRDQVRPPSTVTNTARESTLSV